MTTPFKCGRAAAGRATRGADGPRRNLKRGQDCANTVRLGHVAPVVTLAVTSDRAMLASAQRAGALSARGIRVAVADVAPMCALGPGNASERPSRPIVERRERRQLCDIIRTRRDKLSRNFASIQLLCLRTTRMPGPAPTELVRALLEKRDAVTRNLSLLQRENLPCSSRGRGATA